MIDLEIMHKIAVAHQKNLDFVKMRKFHKEMTDYYTEEARKAWKEYLELKNG